MPQRSKALEPSLSARAWFGAELRYWRTLRRLSQDALGALVHVSGDLIAKIEKAQRLCKPDLAAAIDAALDTGGVLSRGLQRVAGDADKRQPDVDKPGVDNRASQPANVAASSTPKAAADVRRTAGSEVDPAALGAAMTLMNGDVRVACRMPDGRITFVTMPRRSLLRSATAAAGATLLPVGGPPPNRVSPARPAPVELLSSDVHPVENFRALRRSLVECDNFLGPRNVVADVQEHIRQIQRLRQQSSGRDRQDLMQVQAEYAEFCSWLYQDSGDFRAAQYWADRAIEWSTVAGDHDLTIYTMARKSQLAGDMRNPLDTVDLAEAAQRIAPPQSRLSAMGAVYGAHGHALRGDRRASQTAYDQALDVVAGADDETFRGRWLDAAYVEAQRARSLSALGSHQDAVAGFDRAIRALPASYRRDRGVYLARAALAEVHAIGPESAAISGSAALAIATATGSARIFGELATLDAQLQRWSSVTEVVEFREALDNVMLHHV